MELKISAQSHGPEMTTSHSDDKRGRLTTTVLQFVVFTENKVDGEALNCEAVLDVSV